VTLTPRETTLRVQPASTEAAESIAKPGTGPVVLSFSDISYRRPVGVYYEVYLNKPEAAPPDPSGPYYAGNLALFALVMRTATKVCRRAGGARRHGGACSTARP